MKTWQKALAVVIVVAVVLSGSVYYYLSSGAPIQKSPDFTLADINGKNVTLSNNTGKVVILDFMFIACPGCRIVEKNLKEIYPRFEGKIRIISIDGVDSDTPADLQKHSSDEGLASFANWTIVRDAQQSGGSTVSQMYSVNEFPTIVMIDRDGYATYNKAGEISSSELEREINKALIGTQAIPIQQASLVVLAVMAGIASFFSPCAFPMLPGYMAYFLGLQTSQDQNDKKKLYRRAVLGGIAGGFGIILVYIIIGVLLILLGSLATQYLPYLGPIIGIILIVLGLLMLTNIQYNRIVEPFQRLSARMSRRKKKEEGDEAKEKEMKKGFYGKLFRYGVGYGAAASACVAPLFIVLVTTASAASMTGTILDGVIVLLLYAFVVIALMVAITLTLTYFGIKAAKKMSKYTNIIKKISAVVLVVVGIYLIYFYFKAFG